MSFRLENVAQPDLATSLTQQTNLSSREAQVQFSNTLKQAIAKVNEVENVSNLKTQALINGETNELHDVMLAAQKASIAIETTVQIQRKIIDAYNEIMRMQV